MRIEVNNTISVAKSYATKVKKLNGISVVLAELKFEGLFIDRDYSDEMLGLPIGAVAMLYDEENNPLSLFSISRKHIEYLFAGAITGNQNRNEQIALGKNTGMLNVELQLAPKGAFMSGTFQWRVRGDETEDLAPLLGMTCMMNGLIALPEQIDAFESARETADRITRKFTGDKGARQ